MNKLLLAGIAAVALAAGGSALAADLPVKAPVYKAPVAAPWYDWTGLYVGVNVGGSWGRANTDYTLAGVPIGSTSQNMNGWLGGIQIGYNWQMSPRWVWGIEADIQATGQKGTAVITDPITIQPVCILACPPPVTTIGTLSYAQKLPWFGTLRGRIGMTPADRWLLYVTGGLAVGEIDTDATFSVPGAATGFSFSQTKAGWVVGGGIEAALHGNWTGKIEYLYMDLGRTSNSFAVVPPFAGTLTANSRVTDNIVRIGVNYRFGGPVVARY